jgi:hypothetical protein
MEPAGYQDLPETLDDLLGQPVPSRERPKPRGRPRELSADEIERGKAIKAELRAKNPRLSRTALATKIKARLKCTASVKTVRAKIVDA